MAQIDAEVAALKQRVDTLESAMRDLRESVSVLHSKLGDLRSDMRGLYVSTETNAQALNDRVMRNSRLIEQLGEKIERLRDGAAASAGWWAGVAAAAGIGATAAGLIARWLA